ncbi:Pyridoxamine 5'-phosphate oxidase domain containing protein [Amanita muscaria]
MTIPRWKIAIESAIAQYEKQIVIQLATVDSKTSIPKVRSHILRSFLASPATPSLPLLVTTTDIRAPKVSQIVANPNVQVVHWIESTQEQFRISGRVFMVPAPESPFFAYFMDDIHSAAENTSGIAALVKDGFDWEKKRVDTFKSLSGHMKATWCRPIPGTPLTGGEEEANKWPVKLAEPTPDDTEESKQNWKTALGNFTLLIVDPSECDYCELGVIPNRRTNFTKTDDGNWKEEQLVP